MNNYSKFFIVLAVVFATSTANAVKTYVVTNNSSLITGIDFYYYTDLLSSNLVASNSVASNSTKTINASDISNYVNIRPYPIGSWSGNVIRIDLTNIKDFKFIIRSSVPSNNPNSIKLDVQSIDGKLIDSGVFIKRLGEKKTNFKKAIDDISN
ncbi:MAG: hypothetical protein US49_C0007G0045 [candidate division TM6 bacterium GW2011_GWF2_37_49]|nr:MAG: hypothetical protein US49_C0007G0045 [candidate division TM6 bacterium GW2011_GWF2_37_49]